MQALENQTAMEGETKKMEGVPEVVLNSGWKMPLIGMGTATIENPPVPIFKSIVSDAIKAGYRHFDTASLYDTEKPLGESINEALRQGLIQSRDDLFITSKLWCTDAHHDLVLPALRKTLENLQLECLDLYLIHWPVRLKGEITPFFSKDDVLPIDIKSIWAAMEECQKLGLTKSIGVSNFSCKKLLQLLDSANIPPAVNQVEMNPAWQQKKLKEFCALNRIQLFAYSPLGANGAVWGSYAVMKSPVLKEIAEAKGKSVAQISLRWLYEQGVGLIVKSFNKERMKENLDIFDWELSEEELKKISLIPQQRGCPGDIYVSAEGPYASLEELWDGEI